MTGRNDTRTDPCPGPDAAHRILRALCLLLLLPGWPAAAAGSLVLAVHPYLPDDEIHRRYTPLLHHLEAAIGRRLRLDITRNYGEHETLIGNDRVDIAFMGPAAYVNMVHDHGPKPLLARLAVNGKPVFRGAVVSTEDSAIDNLAQLRGRRFAFGDPESTMSHLVPRYMLQQAGIGLSDLADYQYLNSHVNVALGVLSGDFDAGAVKEEIARRYREQGLRVVAWSPELSEHLFVARADLEPQLVQRLRRTLLALQDSAPGRIILQTLKPHVSALVPVQDSDYDNLRAMLSAIEAGAGAP